MAISFNRVRGDDGYGLLKEEGESLQFISDTLGVKVEDLIELNPELAEGINPGTIRMPLLEENMEETAEEFVSKKEEALVLEEVTAYETEDELPYEKTAEIPKQESTISTPILKGKTSIIWKDFPKSRV